MTIAFLKGHAMNRGTLMVLKRLLVTTLGALGLGALAAGTASGQGAGDGNIPAPNVFDDQIACSSKAPTMPPTPATVAVGDMSSALDEALKGMDNIVGDDDPETDDLFNMLTYVVDPHAPDCGKGPGNKQVLNDQGELVDDVDGDGDAISNDFTEADGNAYTVAKGYSDTLGAFEDLMDAETVQEGAEEALEDAREAATTTNPNTDAIDDAQDALDEANDDLTVARTHYNALAAGPDGANPINKAGVAEWMAKGAVVKAIGDWNDARLAAEDAATKLEGQEYTEADGTSKYIDLTDSHEAQVHRCRRKVQLLRPGGLRLAGYAGCDGEDGADNFDDDTGELIVPMETGDFDGDGTMTTRRMAAAVTSVGNIREQVDGVNKAVEALEDAIDDNVNPLRTDALAEGLRRAKLEQAHWQEQLDNALADNTDLMMDEEIDEEDDNEAEQARKAGTHGVQSIASYNAAYKAAASEKTAAAADLRVAAMQREAATAAVIDAFNSAGAFYQQLVDLQQYAKDKADNAVTALAGDATEAATKTATDAAESAAMALMKAEESLANYNTLQNPEDENDPRKALGRHLAEDRRRRRSGLGGRDRRDLR